MKYTPENTLAEVLEKLSALHPKKIDLSLSRMTRLLAALDHPERKLPPVFHVAGTNGKGSVVAYLRAILEAAGFNVHVYTSPHLVNFRERIRLRGQPITEDFLIDVLERTEKANQQKPITFFEITTAAALLAFSEIPADVLLLEVGLGGRLDATNVVPKPLSTIITPVGLDHADFLGDKLEKVAQEKAGICKAGVPVIIGPQDRAGLEGILQIAKKVRAKPFQADKDFTSKRTDSGFIFLGFGKTMALPRPALAGDFQIDNAALAIAALLTQKTFPVREKEIQKGLQNVCWPARFQRLDPKSLGFPKTANIWLDGGHNPLAGEALATILKEKKVDNLIVIAGMMQGKNPEGFFRPFAHAIERLVAIPIPNQENSRKPAEIIDDLKDLDFISEKAPSLEGALSKIPPEKGLNVLITGSLYLAGEVLKTQDQTPK